MDEMLLNELYGSEEARQDEEVKLAQAELVEAVAAEAGVDLNELDDEELEKFAHYVLSDEDEVIEETVEEAVYADNEKIAEAELMGRTMARAYADEMTQINSEGESMDKVASAMYDVAEAWEMQKIAESDTSGRDAAIGGAAGALALGGGALGARALSNRALSSRRSELGEAQKARGLAGKARMAPYERALAEQERLFGELAGARSQVSRMGAGRGSALTRADLQSRMNKRKGKMSKIKELMGKSKAKFDESDAAKKLDKSIDSARDALSAEKGSFRRHLRGLSGGQLAALGAGGAALGAGGAYLASRKRKKSQEKKASLLLEHGYEALAVAELYEPEEFAKEAELRAAEILAANGIHPETFEEIYPEEIKLASFPGVEDAADYDEAVELAEYNEMLDAAAEHILENLLED